MHGAYIDYALLTKTAELPTPATTYDKGYEFTETVADILSKTLYVNAKIDGAENNDITAETAAVGIDFKNIPEDQWLDGTLF